MKLSVEEFSHDHLDEDKTRIEVGEFLSKELTKDFNKVIKKLQDAKVTPLVSAELFAHSILNLWSQREMA